MTKDGCSLCETAKITVENVIQNYPAELKMIDIESDPQLFEKYKEKIPVVLINGVESFVYKVHEVTLQKKLEKILES